MENAADVYRRFLGGDREALVDLIRLTRDGLALYLLSLAGDAALAEELCEEVYVRLVVKRPRFLGKSAFKTWLYAIGRHVAMDELRRRARRREVPLEEAASAEDEESLERALLQEERRVALHRAMGRLRPAYREALSLSYFQDFSNEETAKVLGKSRRQVENLLYNAKKALKMELLKEGFSDEDL